MFNFKFDFKVIQKILWINRGMFLFIIPIALAAILGYVYFMTKINLYIDDIAEDNYSIKPKASKNIFMKDFFELSLLGVMAASLYMRYKYIFWALSAFFAFLLLENIFKNREKKIEHTFISKLIFIISLAINSAFLGAVIYFYYEFSNILNLGTTTSILILVTTYNFLIFAVPYLSNMLLYPLQFLTKSKK